MKIVGITGPIGSGKSYVSAKIAGRGVPVIDTDEVYHSMTVTASPLVDELCREFGKGIRDENGGLDRKKLADIVFSDRAKLLKLNEISHKAVGEETDRLIAEYGQKGTGILLIEVPLMFESGFDKKCDLVVSVIADEALRIKRVCKRNNMSEENVKKRIENQKDNDFYIANSSVIVYNNEGDDLDAQLDAVFRRLGE